LDRGVASPTDAQYPILPLCLLLFSFAYYTTLFDLAY